MYFRTPLALAAAAVGSATAASDACQPLRGSDATAPTPNTPETFASFSYYDDIANSTAYRSLYERAVVAGDAAIRSDRDYITYTELPSYDVGACAKACDGLKACTSFNIYFLRYPSLIPGPKCPNPKASVVVRCAFFSAPMSAAQATNNGQLLGPADEDGNMFEVLIRGSNTYNHLVSPSGRATVTATVTVSATTTVTSTVTKTLCPKEA